MVKIKDEITKYVYLCRVYDIIFVLNIKEIRRKNVKKYKAKYYFIY